MVTKGEGGEGGVAFQQRLKGSAHRRHRADQLQEETRCRIKVVLGSRETPYRGLPTLSLTHTLASIYQPAVYLVCFSYRNSFMPSNHEAQSQSAPWHSPL